MRNTDELLVMCPSFQVSSVHDEVKIAIELGFMINACIIARSSADAIESCLTEILIFEIEFLTRSTYKEIRLVSSFRCMHPLGIFADHFWKA